MQSQHTLQAIMELKRLMYPLDSNCFQYSLVYICKTATLKIRNNYTYYIGLTENNFKARLHKHKISSRYKSKKNETEVSNFLWENKHGIAKTSLESKRLDKAKSYKPVTRKCVSYLIQKYYVLFSKINMLNSVNR